MLDFLYTRVNYREFAVDDHRVASSSDQVFNVYISTVCACVCAPIAFHYTHWIVSCKRYVHMCWMSSSNNNKLRSHVHSSLSRCWSCVAKQKTPTVVGCTSCRSDVKKKQIHKTWCALFTHTLHTIYLSRISNWNNVAYAVTSVVCLYRAAFVWIQHWR